MVVAPPQDCCDLKLRQQTGARFTILWSVIRTTSRSAARVALRESRSSRSSAAPHSVAGSPRAARPEPFTDEHRRHPAARYPRTRACRGLGSVMQWPELARLWWHSFLVSFGDGEQRHSRCDGRERRMPCNARVLLAGEALTARLTRGATAYATIMLSKL